MRKLFASFVLLCCVSSLHAESLLYTTSFTEWENQTVSGEQMMSYSGIDFAVSYVKIVPNSKPTSVSSYEGTGYIQPSNGSNLSSCYFQTGKLSYVSTVNYTQAAGTAGCGWRLESSSDGVNFYPFNENDAGCTSKNTPEIREANVFMNDVWLRWAPITSGTNTTNIYLLDINIYGEEGGMGTADLQRVYCKMNFQWWTESGAAVGIYAYGDGDITNAAWPGERMVLVDADNGVWTAEVDKSKFTHIIFTRMNPSDDGGSLDWGAQTENLSIPSPDAPVFVMTSSAAAWNESGARVQGYWAAYNEDGNYDTHNVRLTTGFTPEESAAYVYPSSGDYETGSTVSLNAEISTGGWMFDHWSDNGSWDNPRTVTLTQDTTITAVFSPGEYGILINRGRLVRGTYTGRENEHTYVGQFKASVSLQEGDRIQIINLFHSDNSTWRPEIEEGGMSGNFSVDEGLDALMCNQTGCYDIYMKIHYGQSSDYVYIGGGEDCSEGEVVNIDGSGEITEYVYSLVGTAQLFGTAWDVNDSTVLQQEGTNLWSYTLQSVHLNAFQKYEYKVVTNHSWEVGTYPSNSENYSFHVPHTGYYSVHFSFNVTTGASVTETSVIEDESYKDTLVYSNYAVTINGERIVPCVYAGVGDAGLPEYLARVQLQSGEYMEVIDRSNNNAKVGYSMDEYGLSGNFIYKNDSNRYSCSVSGCYDVYYKTDGAVYFGAGSGACSQGLPFDGSVLATGELYLSGPSYISSDSQKGWVKLDGSNNTTTITQRIALGATVTIEAVPNSGYQFLQWSDNNYANPRELVITGDSIIQAEMGSIDLYPVGILLNRKKFVRSTFNDGAQLTVRANIQQGDTVELYYTTSNIYFMAPLEQYGAYTNFTEQSEENRLICNVSGCYDIYFKLQEGITQTIYIGEGTQCFDGVDWTAPAEPDYVYSLVGTANLFGEAWVTQDTTTEMKLQGENMYTYTIDSIALYPDSSYQYKVISNHEWNVKEYPNFEENYTLFVEEPGVYQVLFMLDPSVGCSATTNYLHAIQETQPCVSPIASGTCSDDQTVSVVFKTASSDGTTAYSDDSSIKENLVNSYSGIEKFTGERLYAGKSGIKLGSTSASGSITMQLSTPITASMIIVEASQYGSDNATLSISVNGSTTFGEQLTVTSDVLTFNNPETLINSLTVTTTTKQRVYIRAITIFSNSSSGGGLNWSISCDSVLTISGSGAMPDYANSDYVPWFNYRTSIREVYVEEGVTSLGKYAFSNCTTLWNVDLPSTLISIGEFCFGYCAYIDTITCRAVTPPVAYSSTFADDNYMLTVYVPKDKTDAYQAAEGWNSFTDFRELTSSCTSPIASGTCGAEGDNLAWQITCDNVLFISGTGAMANYAGASYTPWHEYQTSIQYAVIDSGVTSLSNSSTFEECSALEGVIIPEGITSLGSYTFSNCTSLKGIDLPSTLTELGSYCFNGCDVMDSIVCRATTPPSAIGSTFSSAIENIPVYVPAGTIADYQAANGWSGFKNFRELVSSCIIASGECGAQGDNVTWSLSCDSVLTISGTGAMADYSLSTPAPWYDIRGSIKQAIIKNGVTSIGYYAFRECSILTSVTISNSVTSIVNYAFSGCSSLTSVTIPNSVTIIGVNVFQYCSSLTSVEIPNSVKSIGGSAFQGCSGLTNVTISNKVKIINNSVFANCSSLTSVVIPDSVTRIDNTAFNNCSALKTVTIPNSVISIGNSVFSGCSSLTSVEIPNSVTSIGNYLFNGCSGLTNVTFPDGVTIIQERTFWRCSSLSTFEIPNSVKSIGNSAFYDCSSLTSVTIPDSVTSIDNEAFWGCSGLTGDLDIPNSVTSIGASAFKSCSGLTSLTIGNNVTNISGSAFQGCSGLTSIVVDNGNMVYNSRNNCNAIIETASNTLIVGCQNTIIPASVTSIGAYAFSGCSGLTGDLVIPNNITSIGNYAFYGCSGLTNVTIPDSITSIGGWTFAYCSGLTSVTINNSITSIGASAFQKCSGLMSVTIGHSVSNIGGAAFHECSGLTSITCEAATPPSCANSTFYKVSTSTPVYVPYESIAAYQAADGWSSFTDIRAIPGTEPCTTPIASGTCGVDDNLSWEISCDSIFTITGTGAMKEGDDEKWYDMRMSIKKVVIGDGITNLVDHAFRQAENIKEVIIGEGVTKIGQSAFWGCGNIQTIVLPSTLDTIAEQAFRSCADLTYIDLPTSVKYIGNWAFAYCSYVDSIICRATTPPTLDQEPFYDISTSVPVYVPYRTAATYQSAEGWSRFTNIIELPDCIIASGECGALGDNVTWSLSCDSVMTISGQGAMANYNTNSNGQAPWASYGSQIRDIVIEEGVTRISAYGFYNAGSYTNGAYNNVRSVSIPSTVGKMENNYFYQCPIETVSINSDSIVGKASYSSGATLHRMFGAQVREYYIGNEVKSIANSAFYNQSADSLTTITLPEGLESIGTWAFGYLEHLTFINIPNNVTTIGSDAFAGCTELETVVLGESLTSIGAQAFWKDSKLRYITCNAINPPTLNSTAFDVYGTLNVPCEAKQSYREADYWKQFSLITCGDEMVITFELSSDWTFVMIPGLFGMQPEDVTVNGEVTWATYNGSVRAMGASGWELFDAESVHMCSQALIARAKQGTVTLNIVVPNQARNKQEVYVPVSQHPATYAQNANWCFIGNPYPYEYNITDALEDAEIYSPVTIWNGTGYTTYTPGIDEFTLQPFQPFFIQLSDDAPENILFTPDYITE